MSTKAEANLLRIFISESDRWEGRPLYEALVRAARESGLAGATVMRGVEGFGSSSRIHTVKVAHLADNLPMVVEIIDEPDAIERFLPVLDKMVADGMVTLEKTSVILYRQRGDVALPESVSTIDDDELELDTTEYMPSGASTAFATATDEAREVIESAKTVATEAHRGFVDSVDILLAMLQDSNGIGRRILKKLDVKRKILEQRLHDQVSRETPTDQFLPLLDEKTASEANWLEHKAIGAEHLLLALCEIRPSAATDILMQMGVQPREICRKVLEELGRGDDWQRWIADHPDM